MSSYPSGSEGAESCRCGLALPSSSINSGCLLHPTQKIIHGRNSTLKAENHSKKSDFFPQSQRKAPGPQGFRAGQLRAKGYLSCFRNCGAQFRNKDEEENHYKKGRETCPNFIGGAFDGGTSIVDKLAEFKFSKNSTQVRKDQEIFKNTLKKKRNLVEPIKARCGEDSPPWE